MIRIKNLVGRDRVSIGLLAMALSSLLLALAATAMAHPSAIPERLLDRVRGATPGLYRTVDPNSPNCTALYVYSLTSAGYGAVDWRDCNAANIGTACYQCADTPNYKINSGPGNPLAYKPVSAVDCNAPNGSSSGTCQLIGNPLTPTCNLMNGCDCDQYAASYGLEP